MADVYAIALLAVIGFQIALIFGAPWGRITQGGQVDGPLPPSGRVIAGISIAILVGMALAILSAEGRWPNWPAWTGWAAVGVNAISMVLNWITPSRAERMLWGPVMTALCVLAVAIVWR